MIVINDFAKLGVPLQVLAMVATLLAVPLMSIGLGRVCKLSKVERFAVKSPILEAQMAFPDHFLAFSKVMVGKIEFANTP